MSQPQQVAARVVLPPGVVMQFIAALSENLKNYETKYNMPLVPAPQTAPGAAAGGHVSAQELYEQLKLQDDVLSGNYANAVMIGHTPSEFCFDFITTFYPRSAVSCRVFMAAPGVPRLLDSLKHSFEKFQQKWRSTSTRRRPRPLLRRLSRPPRDRASRESTGSHRSPRVSRAGRAKVSGGPAFAALRRPVRASGARPRTRCGNACRGR